MYPNQNPLKKQKKTKRVTAYDVRRVGSLLTCCCGGEGMFNTSLMGPGTVWLQTLSYDRLISQLVTVREAAAAGAAGGAAASSGGDE
mmetsp:Transcript_29358/g.72339  ORF Transcript_29358/g.72339 Transcript_29358/m.72339 type:complete len:87 (+) Transcript_29358:195-455(+)